MKTITITMTDAQAKTLESLGNTFVQARRDDSEHVLAYVVEDDSSTKLYKITPDGEYTYESMVDSMRRGWYTFDEKSREVEIKKNGKGILIEGDCILIEASTRHGMTVEATPEQKAEEDDVLPPASLPEPDFVATDLARWDTCHGSVVADTTPTSPGIYLYPRHEDQRLVKNPEELIAALRAATARMGQGRRTP